MKSFPDPIFTPVAENIKANREDERKSLLNRFADRQRSLATKIMKEKLKQAEICQLLMDDADRFENEA
ncbi:DUF2732 family protein [Morganella morganii]|uniref:DUF2732 family protein n=1 Tax=Morganella morganii TaxID=582 RepID=UPI00228A5FDB|nr:DUF2732 family protein [Morganella morganii]HEI8438564.1 DUF2732 family protein [Morganella morganii]